jgi:hypothetical protein
MTSHNVMSQKTWICTNTTVKWRLCFSVHCSTQVSYSLVCTVSPYVCVTVPQSVTFASITLFPLLWKWKWITARFSMNKWGNWYFICPNTSRTRCAHWKEMVLIRWWFAVLLCVRSMLCHISNHTVASEALAPPPPPPPPPLLLIALSLSLSLNPVHLPPTFAKDP